jgi:hypothetical protein
MRANIIKKFTFADIKIRAELLPIAYETFESNMNKTCM